MGRDRFDELEEEYKREGDIEPILDRIRELDGDDDDDASEEDDSV